MERTWLRTPLGVFTGYDPTDPAAARPDARLGGVFLRADSGVPYGAVVRVLAGLRAAGLENVGRVATTDAGS